MPENYAFELYLVMIAQRCFSRLEKDVANLGQLTNTKTKVKAGSFPETLLAEKE
jgi:hypothetical protein